MVERWTESVGSIPGADLMPAIGQASLNIAMAKVSTGADDARRLRYLLPTDGISLNRDHLLYHARQRALGMARAGYRKPRPRMLAAAGHDAAKTIGMQIWSMQEGGYASEHDALIGKKLAHVLCGGELSEPAWVDPWYFLDLEREAFLSLLGEQKTRDRMTHMLQTGKPLRN